jgi:hypothetical protein
MDVCMWDSLKDGYRGYSKYSMYDRDATWWGGGLRWRSGGGGGFEVAVGQQGGEGGGDN